MLAIQPLYVALEINVTSLNTSLNILPNISDDTQYQPHCIKQIRDTFQRLSLTFKCPYFVGAAKTVSEMILFQRSQSSGTKIQRNCFNQLFCQLQRDKISASVCKTGSRFGTEILSRRHVVSHVVFCAVCCSRRPKSRQRRYFRALNQTSWHRRPPLPKIRRVNSEIIPRVREDSVSRPTRHEASEWCEF